jgi:hypothetical protein
VQRAVDAYPEAIQVQHFWKELLSCRCYDVEMSKDSQYYGVPRPVSDELLRDLQEAARSVDPSAPSDPSNCLGMVSTLNRELQSPLRTGTWSEQLKQVAAGLGLEVSDFELLTPKQIAKRLRVSWPAARKYMRRGNVPFVMVTTKKYYVHLPEHEAGK